MRRPRQAWRKWPKRRAVRCVTREIGAKKLQADYVLECGHVVWREGAWVGPYPAGSHEMKHVHWRVHCGSCFHGMPAGHRSPYDGRSAFFEQFDDGVQLELGLDVAPVRG